MIGMIVLAIQAVPASYDAVVAAPNSHHILLEDDKIRVLRVEVAPGATEPVHDHRWPSVMYFEQPQRITYISYKLVNGRPVKSERFDAPTFAKSQTLKGDVEELHAVMNRGSHRSSRLRLSSKPAICPRRSKWRSGSIAIAND